eukprot:CAMPEP_0171243586 /NCGR_PEP_ID=MMETSP0790-20130122/46369_1 /TAXON_ID=2925 /ORGANISM="Alexandrium catenella, Strain OF101" /LENGTH=146 /DNA_ID=CAMNT_0011710595 /DNA_START=40 /DNA_END=477 /DNA_ORIENTATION=+
MIKMGTENHTRSRTVAPASDEWPCTRQPIPAPASRIGARREDGQETLRPRAGATSRRLGADLNGALADGVTPHGLEERIRDAAQAGVDLGHGGVEPSALRLAPKHVQEGGAGLAEGEGVLGHRRSACGHRGADLGLGQERYELAPV